MCWGRAEDEVKAWRGRLADEDVREPVAESGDAHGVWSEEDLEEPREPERVLERL